jgi:hypothetical protein
MYDHIKEKPEDRDARTADAFNEGSDARIFGVSFWDNPYDAKAAPREYWGWRAGWADVHTFWGTYLPEKLRTPLPQVRPPELDKMTTQRLSA